MATLTVSVPAQNATQYLHEIIRQINEGMTSGHVDAETNWEVVDWDDEAADDLA
ncbi:hypothetical protein [Gordonia malaquae]|uniref:hypothetical protein n=1 Tax=Gordonia malaquae TaxID=410332 RepID=UPI00301AC2F2